MMEFGWLCLLISVRIAMIHPCLLYSSRSPGWQSSASHSAVRVEIRIALAVPVLRIDMLAMVMPTRRESSVRLIYRFASITSMLKMISPFSSFSIFSPLSDGQVALLLQIRCLLHKVGKADRSHRHRHAGKADQQGDQQDPGVVHVQEEQ